MTEAPDPLPCPFCGNPGQTNIPPHRQIVYCSGCPTKCEDALVWNTRTDADAHAALERVKREARNEALREAATHVSNLQETNAKRVSKAILALMEDTDDD